MLLQAEPDDRKEIELQQISGRNPRSVNLYHINIELN